MFKKIIFPVAIFYFLAILQASFLPHFEILGFVPNIVLFSVILINFFEKTDGKIGLSSAFLGGLFLDIFSSNFFGFYTAVSLSIAIFLKYFLRKYVKIPAWM